MNGLRRAEFLEAFLGVASSLHVAIAAPPAVGAFEGGVGGLGKTKPETGVEFLEGSVPLQNDAGLASAELLVRGRPVRVEFQSPWPLLFGSRGLEARDLRTSDSAFVQVVDDVATLPSSPQAAKELLLRSIFAPQGKFSAYGSPFDVTVKALPGGPQDQRYYAVSFTTLTPGLRESERKAIVAIQAVAGNSLVLLVAGSTAARFQSQRETFEQVARSLVAYEAPPVWRTKSQPPLDGGGD